MGACQPRPLNNNQPLFPSPPQIPANIHIGNIGLAPQWDGPGALPGGWRLAAGTDRFALAPAQRASF